MSTLFSLWQRDEQLCFIDGASFSFLSSFQTCFFSQRLQPRWEDRRVPFLSSLLGPGKLDGRWNSQLDDDGRDVHLFREQQLSRTIEEAVI